MNETDTLYVRCLSNPQWAADEIRRLHVLAQTPPPDAERYRWFRAQRSERKLVITEMSGDEGHMLDHFIDKARCGL